MDELKKKLEEARKALKALVALGENASDEQVEKIAQLHKDAAKYEALIAANEELEKAETENAARIEREKRQAVEDAVKAEQARARRLQFSEAPYQTRFDDASKYDEYSAADVALTIEILNNNGKRVSGGAFKALTLKISELTNKSNTEEEERGINYVKNAFKAANPGIDLGKASEAVKAATDPMYTGGSGIGSDWVGTEYSRNIWETIRAQNVIFGRIPSQVVNDGFSSIYIPLESTDPNWYKVAEATASDSTLKVPAATITASQMATANKQLTLGKLGARSLFTGELTEDSLISFASQLREQLTKSGAEILEHVMIDGDVETSANKNINSIDGTPTSTNPYLLLDGFRKLALVTNTANSRSAGGTLTEDDYIDTLKLMGTAGLAGSDPSQVVFLADYNTHYANMKISTIKTRDVFSAATIEQGFVRRMFGYEILPAFQQHRSSAKRMANTSGKISDTDSNNTTGAIVAVRLDQWKQAFKRRMTLETTRIANADSWEIVALVRWGMAYRDSEASAVTYNVGV